MKAISLSLWMKVVDKVRRGGMAAFRGIEMTNGARRFARLDLIGALRYI